MQNGKSPRFSFSSIHSPSIKDKSQSCFASRIYSFFQENFLYGLRHENSPEKECGGKRIRIKGKITGINCDRRDA